MTVKRSLRGLFVQTTNGDFRKFWVGQSISNLGSSLTDFALPLLVFTLTGSALNLAISMVMSTLPYLLFGLVMGAWVDHVNRKRLMIITDILRACIIVSIPLLSAFGLLSIWWIYIVMFVSSTLSVGFNIGQFAATPSLVKKDDLATANGRIQASYSAATVVGPLLGGLALTVMPLPTLLIFDALSFVISATSLIAIKTYFNAEVGRKQTSISLNTRILKGLRYVFHNPVLLSISILVALVNLVNVTSTAQIVLFAKQQLLATDTQVGLLYSAGSIGVLVLSLATGPLLKRLPFSKVALGAFMLKGLCTLALSLTQRYWIAVPLWALCVGLVIPFNISTTTLRQKLVPDYLLGRVISVAIVLATSMIPVGALVGGFVIEKVGNIASVYAGIGVLVFLISFIFLFTPLGRAEHYLTTSAPDTH